MSQSSFEPVMPVFHWCACSIVRIADFLSPRHIVYDRSTNMAAASLSYKVFEKAVKCAMTKVKIGQISSLTEPQSRSLFNFLRGNDTFVSLPTGHGKSLIYQICPAVARELASIENQFPSEPVVVVISPLISLIADQISSCERMGINSF